ncbi:MAG TPA: OsmC family protein [Hanamia sp.]|nr:OsmC family protein [Hanamia sp.]
MPKIIATAEVTNDYDKYLSRIRINKHELLVDEPLNNGGEDLGPAPGDYLCAALASCKAITLRMYAQRKQWKIEEIKVTANLVLGKESASGNNTFFCRISFKGDLDKEQQKRLLIIANSCPLHKLLSKPSDIVTTIM